MGIGVLVLGYSGSGKSTSLRNFPENQYGLISVVGKPLPFRSDKKALVTDDYQKIMAALNSSADSIVIDDSQYLMACEYMSRAKEKGFEKFVDMGLNFFNVVRYIPKLPDNKIVYFFHHIETDSEGREKEKTIGKMLDEKICMAGLFTIVIKAHKVDKRFLFATQSTGFDPIKTPIGMFDDEEIDNDLFIVDQKIREYYSLPAPCVIKAKVPKEDTAEKAKE